MTTQSDFVSTRWIRDLAHALRALAEMHYDYRDELLQMQERGNELNKTLEGPLVVLPPGDDNVIEPFSPEAELAPDAMLPPTLRPSSVVGYFYHNAYFAQDPSKRERYRPLRLALERALDILAEHPVIQSASASSTNGFAYWIEIMDQGANTNLLNVVEGLYLHATGDPGNDFEAASTELDSLLQLSQQPKDYTLPDRANVGYHAHLFFGPRVSEQIEIPDGMSVVPLEQISPFISASVLQLFTRESFLTGQQNPTTALIEPFPWTPVLQPQREEPEPDPALQPPLLPPFVDVASLFTELLAITHASPIGTVLSFPYCIHPSTSGLLGSRETSVPVHAIPSRLSHLGFHRAPPVRADAFATAITAFGHRNDSHFNQYKPVISRLAQSLLRHGEFGLDDKILDVSIALERMYEIDSGQITKKLRRRGSRFLGDTWEGIKEISNQFGRFYNVRSAIIHHRRASKASRRLLSPKNMERAFDMGYGLARDTLIKLLINGPPDDWNELGISASGN